ncbi:hypothetical protein CLV92_10952 [Kineococcus xinjiangensis]|uniref:Phosphodiesterase n=1 Tax=Kineococcus xinjiangensis TaxID=512762 RepID=A0A2S6IHW7_9ACTN|nr:hypothetical protein [Kineococcus xinjiangensis]PPK93776.1 hypothetical protein CLV92_10952 [Kineococcus xinjiangensis]
MTVEQAPGRTSARTSGHLPAPAVPALAAVDAVMAGVSRLRSGRKAAHPSGRTVRGVLHRAGLSEGVGVPWLDEPGWDEAVVRLSRGAGLPEVLPDLLGLALRVHGEDGAPYDLLLSTTGLSPLRRHVLALRRDPMRSAYTSVVSHRGPAGPLALAAIPASRAAGFVLAVASPAGPWRPFAHLEVGRGPALPDVAFDPVLHAVPGLAPGPWMAAVRRAAYAGSRRGRGARLDASGGGSPDGSPDGAE